MYYSIIFIIIVKYTIKINELHKVKEAEKHEMNFLRRLFIIANKCSLCLRNAIMFTSQTLHFGILQELSFAPLALMATDILIVIKRYIQKI
jgi:hypothetical protein